MTNMCELIEQIKDDYEKSDCRGYRDFCKDYQADFSDIALYPMEKNNGFMIFGTEEFAEKDEKYSFYNKTYKHKYYAYYDLRRSKDYKRKEVTYILFNPSFANPIKTDDTINNCLKLARLNDFSSVEIINLFSHRNAEVTAECATDNETNLKFIKEFLVNKRDASIVLAWGFGKENKSFCQNTIQEVKNTLSNIDKSCCLLKLGVREEVLKNVSNQILHPAKSTWSVFGGFLNAAELVEYK